MVKYFVSAADFILIGIGLTMCLYIALTVAKIYCRGKVLLRRELNIIVLIIYSVFIAAVSFFPLYFYIVYSGSPEFHMSNVNLIPLSTFIYNIENLAGNTPKGTNALQGFITFFFGNLFLLFPMGLLLPQISKKCSHLSYFFFLMFDISLIKEIIQFFETSYGYAPGKGANTDDLILNVIGAVLGFLLLRFLKKRFNFSE